jgi:hypothetical protein
MGRQVVVVFYVAADGSRHSRCRFRVLQKPILGTAGSEYWHCLGVRGPRSIAPVERSPDDVRLPDLEPLFVCQTCGRRGADVRPPFEPAPMGTSG